MTAAKQVCVGVVTGPHGVAGAVRIKSFTQHPADIAAYGPLADETGRRRLELRLLGAAKGVLIARLAGVEDRNRAEELRGLRLYLPRAALPAPAEEEYYHADLIGLAAALGDGTPLGRVRAVHDFGAGDTLEIERADAPPAMVPFTRAIVPVVDIAAGRLVVDPPPGLLEPAPKNPRPAARGEERVREAAPRRQADPLIRDYSEGETSEESKFVMPPRESSIETALHESVHAVILRLYGREIAEVVDQDDRVLTILVEPQKYNVAALMAPEVYMSLNNIAFTDHSVSNDRDAVADCFRPADVESIRKDNRELLVDMFQCPHVLAAISILSARLNAELHEHRAMSGVLIHEIIDPILIYSPYADDLRERLNG